MSANSPRTRILILGLGLLLVAATVITHALWAQQGSERLLKEDIYYVWKEGQQIIQGVNPYQRIVGGSLRENHKYPTYLPLSYLFTAATQWLGAKHFEQFIQIWRPINLASHLLLAWLVVKVYLKKRMVAMGCIAGGILLMGRWSAYIVNVQHLEFTSICALISAALLIGRKPNLSALLLGLSLSIKHLGVILVPAFLIELMAQIPAAERPGRVILRYGLLMLLLPAVTSIPFLITSPDGFLLNMLFSFSRSAASNGQGAGSNVLLLGVDGARIFLVALLGLNFVALAKKSITFWTSCTFGLLIFLQFNPVVFEQYFIWLLSVGLIAAANPEPEALAPPVGVLTQLRRDPKAG